jgi:Uri superfamily endonuclease
MTASAAGGTYILLIELASPSVIEIGKLGDLTFDAGCYAYVGSAHGPGGLAARLGRYLTGRDRRHWHIDHLLGRAKVFGALFRADRDRRECTWARWLGKRAQGWIPRFGSSDCRCPSHLFFVGNNERMEEMIRAAGCELKATPSIEER